MAVAGAVEPLGDATAGAVAYDSFAPSPFPSACASPDLFVSFSVCVAGVSGPVAAVVIVGRRLIFVRSRVGALTPAASIGEERGTRDGEQYESSDD